jgi:acetylornithine deacetylase/succinyl-diaminopimelate desuccinylase-like protein
MSGRKFYPIQVAEKSVCWMKLTIRGPGGHGSVPMRGGAMSRLGETLVRLNNHRLPVHVHPVARTMIETMARHLPSPEDEAFRHLLDPHRTDQILEGLGQGGRLLDALLHNTVNATVVKGGEKINVVPSTIELHLDGRLLPGQGPEDLKRELRDLLGGEPDLELIRFDPAPDALDMGLFGTLSGILKDNDSDGIPIPMLTAGFTDARLFARLGIQTYGFTPMNLPEWFGFGGLIHSADERIPVEALEFGVHAVHELTRRYGRSPESTV